MKYSCCSEYYTFEVLEIKSIACCRLLYGLESPNLASRDIGIKYSSRCSEYFTLQVLALRGEKRKRKDADWRLFFFSPDRARIAKSRFARHWHKVFLTVFGILYLTGSSPCFLSGGNGKSADKALFHFSPDRARTCNPPVNSRMLCKLRRVTPQIPAFGW